jgi:hypothetical protein
LVLVATVALPLACGGGGRTPGSPDPGVSIVPTPSAAEAAERVRVSAALSAVADVDPTGLAARYPTAFASSLGYDPLTAANLPLIRNSRLGLNPAEEQVLAQNGFVISSRQQFPTFTYGYVSIYSDDLPLYISADSILYAVHRSYDALLEQIETTSLRPALKTLLAGMREALAGGTVKALGGETAKDLDLYLAVASGLLDPAAAQPVAGASSSDIKAILDKATAADGSQGLTLFGVDRTEDFSQFKPRGHYTDSPELTSYFKAMMWLGRTDFRLLETQPEGTQLFRRRQFDGALGLATLVTSPLAPQLETIERTVAAFVGENDAMRAGDFPALLARLGVASPQATVALDDAVIAAAIVEGDFGAQRISSHIMVNGLGKGTLPLSRSFLLLGQRYVVDSHVFSNLVYDRVQQGAQNRMMPDPLDVAFTVFANNHAATLLAPQLEQYHYAPDLAAMRVLVDDHGDAFWGGNLYNEWLGAVRALSRTGAEASAPLPIARTEAWGRRTLNAQLASWAELRHDTILYAKQSYGAAAGCEFPDVLVEPSPAFFARLKAYAAKGSEVMAALGGGAPAYGQSASSYFAHLGEVAGMLEEMARMQEQGTPFTDAQMAFVNQAVKLTLGCAGPAGANGWYADLFYGSSPIDFSPTIADVHTQPTDEAGNEVGRVLHVGTGNARLMVLTANTCTGVRAYAGLVSSYFEEVTEDWKRLDDPSWEKRFSAGGTPPADVPWLSGLIAH